MIVRDEATELAGLAVERPPGPEADADTLKAHYRRVQDVFATHAYDIAMQLCHWCLKWGELAFSKTDQPRGTRMFCTARCANAYTAYQIKVLSGGRVRATAATPSNNDETEDDTYDLPPGAAQPTPTRRRRRVALASITNAVGQEGTGKTEWKPASEPRTRKPRAAKPARADGKCAKGVHDMTPDNEYHYQGNVWCRECRKASRAASAAKKNGS